MHYLPSSCAEVKNAWSYTFMPPYVFMAWCMVKHRDKFAFTLPKSLKTYLYNVPNFLFKSTVEFIKQVTSRN